MSFLKSHLKVKIGYKSFPLENYIYKPELDFSIGSVNHFQSPTINTNVRGYVETTNKSAYENLTSLERKKLIKERYNF